MKRLLILFVLMAAAALGSSPKTVLLVAGKPSHGSGEHEFPSGCDVLADALNASGLDVKASVHYGKWPEPEILSGIDTLVVYCDGRKKHLAIGHEADLLRLSNQGKGIVFLHFAVDGTPGLLNETLMKVIGGHYDLKESENPVWTMKDPEIADHAVTRGVLPFEWKDEWYYNLRFGDVVPILQAIPPAEERAHTLAWVFGDHAFGFTGGHFHSGWLQPDFRKMVLNAIVWSAGLDVPEAGVESAQPLVARHATIQHAIAKGDAEDVMNHLLLGADVNERNKQGWTPLHFATVRGKTECAEVLVCKGAKLDVRTGTEKTPLHLAADRGFLKITNLLVEGGADVGARDNEGWSPLHCSAEKDHVDVAAFLIASGATVDMRSRRGGTPLHEASASAGPEMINLLLENGADPTIKAANGKTPLDYAIELGNEAAIPLLQ